VGLAVAFVGVMIAGVQAHQGHRREITENTFRVVEGLQTEQARLARFRVRQINDLAEAMNWDFEKLDPGDRAMLASVGSSFGFAGAMCRAKRINERMFMDFWANSVVENHRKLSRYRIWRMKRFQDERGSSWAHFDWLAQRAERHLKRMGRVPT
jgi:hypothetical protein